MVYLTTTLPEAPTSTSGGGSPPASSVGITKYKEVRNIIFSPDETKIAIGYAKNGWVIWDTNTGKKLHAFPRFKRIKFSPDSGSIFFIGYPENLIKKYHLTTNKQQGVHTFSSKIHDFRISPSAKQLVSTKNVFQLKNNSYTEMGEISITSYDAFCWDHTETHIAAGNREGNFFIWKFTNGNWKLLSSNHLGEYITNINFSLDDKNLAIFSHSNITIYNKKYKQHTKTAIGYFIGGTAAFSRDWKLMVLPSLAGGFLLYDLQKNKDLIKLPSQQFKEKIDKMIGLSKTSWARK